MFLPPHCKRIHYTCCDPVFCVLKIKFVWFFFFTGNLKIFKFTFKILIYVFVFMLFLFLCKALNITEGSKTKRDFFLEEMTSRLGSTIFEMVTPDKGMQGTGGIL